MSEKDKEAQKMVCTTVSIVLNSLCDQYDLDERETLQMILEKQASQPATEIVFLDDLPPSMRNRSRDDNLATMQNKEWLERTGTQG